MNDENDDDFINRPQRRTSALVIPKTLLQHLFHLERNGIHDTINEHLKLNCLVPPLSEANNLAHPYLRISYIRAMSELFSVQAAVIGLGSAGRLSDRSASLLFAIEMMGVGYVDDL